MIYMAKCYNWAAGNDFITFGSTPEEAVQKLTIAYAKYYDFDWSDIPVSPEEYLTCEKDLRLYKVDPDRVYVDNEMWNIDDKNCKRCRNTFLDPYVILNIQERD